MKKFVAIIFLPLLAILVSSCIYFSSGKRKAVPSESDSFKELTEFIGNIKAVDNHAHPNTIEPDDKGSDALPLDGFGPIELPARVRPESKVWLDAARALYGFAVSELNPKEIKVLSDLEAKTLNTKKLKFPEWVLDQAGIEVMLANRIFMGFGISSPRFRWVAYIDALLFPLSTNAESRANPDRRLLYPMEDAHLKNFLSDVGLSKLPVTLDEYLKKVVTATLEAQRKGGCLAVKFEVSYLRSLDFDKVEQESAAKVYSQFVKGGEPSHEKYKLLQDFLFRYISREAGRLGMAVHIHSFTGVGDYFVTAGCDPLLLEPVFNDPELRKTKFVIIHGGGYFSKHTSAMLWKPNVYADISLLTQLWTPDQVASLLRDWLSQFPEKVLFGTDAVAFGPGIGWDMSAWVASTSGRQALTIALSGMIKDNEISFSRAKEIATMVMRTNAGNLYNLGLK